MLRKTVHLFLPVVALLLYGSSVMAQTTITGVVTDESSEGLIGASVVIKGTVNGTVTDFDGSYELTTSKEPPFTLVFSYVGFESQEMEVTEANAKLDVSLKVQGVTGSEVVISASRKPERIIESPVSIERMDAKTITNTPSANFYDAIENLKGVQMNTNSLTFKAVNTRGFATFANTRFVQLIDGMDNAAPGLNFPAGNLVGISELDVNSVELVPGAASALYGANAFNGILIMRSKDPFKQPGLSVMIKGGITQQNDVGNPQQDAVAGTNPFGEYAIRYAKSINDKVAFKFNFSALQGTDWWATDYTPSTDSPMGSPGYDGMNLYGDEVATSLTLVDPTTGTAGPVRIARTGYKELDLVDDEFDATSYKLDGALHWRVGENAELIYNYRYGAGQSVYQGANRYRLRGLNLQQHKIELKGDNYMLRGYTTRENAGNSYDTRFMAFNINRAAKSDQDWFLDYVVAYNGIQNFVGAINPAFVPLIPQSLVDMMPGVYNDADARAFADGNSLNNDQITDPAGLAFLDLAAQFLGLPGWNRTDKPRLEPGTEEFIRTRDQISEFADLVNGSRFIDNTRLYHAEGNYNIAPHINEFMDVQFGGSFRYFILDSEGTIFNDGPSGFQETIPIQEWAAYTQLSKKFMDDRLKATASIRYDKSQNFNGQFSPRASLVYSLGDRRQHNIRASYQTGHRNPDTQPQYISLDLGAITLLGTTQENMENWSVDRFYGLTGQNVTIQGTDVRDNSYTVTSVQAFGAAVAAAVAGGASEEEAAAQNAGLLQKATVDYVQPEKVSVYEIGYKGLPLTKLFVDANFYLNQYQDFQAQYQVITPYAGSVLDGTAIPAVGSGDYAVFQLYGNTDTPVTSYGFGLNLEYSLPMDFKVGANYSFSDLNFDQAANPDFQAGFNTPQNRFKVSVGNADVWKGVGFNVAYRWAQGYDYQSSFANGFVEGHNVVDLQVSAKIPKIKSIMKIGVANLLHDSYQTAPGAAFVGRQAYISLTYDELFRK